MERGKRYSSVLLSLFSSAGEVNVDCKITERPLLCFLTFYMCWEVKGSVLLDMMVINDFYFLIDVFLNLRNVYVNCNASS